MELLTHGFISGKVVYTFNNLGYPDSLTSYISHGEEWEYSNGKNYIYNKLGQMNQYCDSFSCSYYTYNSAGNLIKESDGTLVYNEVFYTDKGLVNYMKADSYEDSEQEYGYRVYEYTYR